LVLFYQEKRTVKYDFGPIFKFSIPRGERKTRSRMASFEIPLLDRRGQEWLIITSILNTSNKNNRNDVGIFFFPYSCGLPLISNYFHSI